MLNVGTPAQLEARHALNKNERHRICQAGTVILLSSSIALGCVRTTLALAATLISLLDRGRMPSSATIQNERERASRNWDDQFPLEADMMANGCTHTEYVLLHHS